MRKVIALCVCFTMLLCPISAMAEIGQRVITLPEDDGTLYPVRGVSYGYNHDEEVEKVVVPENIIRLGNELFLGNSNLNEIKLHSKLEKIGKDAFAGTAYYENPENWDQGVLYIEDCLIKANQNEMEGDTYEIRPGTRLIASGAFEGCESLNEIVIPDTIEYVGEDAFAGTGFYNNPENWDQGVLMLDYLLLKVTQDYAGGVLEVKDGIRTIADNAAKMCWELTEVVTPESLVHIGENAFSNCKKLEKISFGKNVETVGRGPFYQCLALEEIVVDEENEHFEVEDGILFNEALTNVVKCPQQLKERVILPSTVSVINAYAFEYCENLERVSILENCVFIGYQAFAGCENLWELTIPESMEYIDHYAFQGCENLREIVIPDNVTYLGKGVFTNCENLEYGVIGDGIIDLQEDLFAGCDNLSYMELGENIKYIARTAFEDTKYICDVKGYENGLLITSGKYLMKVAPDTEVCEIPDGVEVVADGAFSYTAFHENLKKICIPKSLESYNWFAFNDVPDNVKICYEGTAWEFSEIADYGWQQFNLSTKDFRGMTIRMVVLGASFMLVVEMILKCDQSKEEGLELGEEEDDYEE